MVAALCVIVSVQAADVKKIDVTDVWSTSAHNHDQEWTPDGKPIDWRPDGNGWGQGWASAACPDWGSGNYAHNPDTAPMLTFFFDDVYMIETVAVENYVDADGGNYWHGAGMVNVYVSDDNGASWMFVSMPAIPHNNRYDNLLQQNVPEYQAADPFTFDVGMQANAVKFEFVNCGSVRFLNPPYGWDEDTDGAWEYVGNGGDTYVGLNNVMFYTAVPEPMTMGLLALGGLALLRRR